MGSIIHVNQIYSTRLTRRLKKDAALVEWLGHHPFKVGDYWFESNMQYYAELE